MCPLLQWPDVPEWNDTQGPFPFSEEKGIGGQGGGADGVWDQDVKWINKQTNKVKIEGDGTTNGCLKNLGITNAGTSLLPAPVILCLLWLQRRCWWCCRHLKVYLGLGYPVDASLTWLLAGGLRSRQWGCLSPQVAWVTSPCGSELLLNRVIQEEHWWRHTVLHDLVEFTRNYFHFILIRSESLGSFDTQGESHVEGRSIK